MHLWQITDWLRSHVVRTLRRQLRRIRRTRGVDGPPNAAEIRGFAASPALACHDLGSPLTALTIAAGTATRLPDGTPAGVAAPSGEDTVLQVCRAPEPGATGETIASYPTTGTSGVVSMVTAADGSVIAGTYPLGHLVRWAPGTDQATTLGTVDHADFLYGLSAAPDGRVFGGTYPRAQFFEWSAATGIRTLGRVRDRGIDYIRATAHDPTGNALWLGTQPTAALYRHDLASGRTERVPLDVPDDASAVMALQVTGGLVLASLSGTLRVIDTTTRQPVTLTGTPASLTITSLGFVADAQGRAWCSVRVGDDATQRVAAVDPRARSLTVTDLVVAGGPFVGGAEVDGVLHLQAGNYGGAGYRLVPGDADHPPTGADTHWQLDPAPAALAHVLADPDRPRAFVSAYVNGSTGAVDLDRGTTTPLARLGQIEGWAWVDGAIWSGSYPDGALRRYRPDAPTAADNPLQLATLKTLCRQIRPVGVVALDRALWWACVPDYGQRDGALVRVGLDDHAVTFVRPLVAGHSLSAVATHEGRLFVGTSRLDGTMALATCGAAHLVRVDPATSHVVETWTPVRGARSVTALAAHGDTLIALADDTVVALDPVSGRVRRKAWLDVPGADVPGSGALLVRGDALHVAVGRQLVVLDAASLAERSRAPRVTQRLDRASDGSLVSLVATDGSLAAQGAANPSRLARWT